MIYRAEAVSTDAEAREPEVAEVDPTEATKPAGESVSAGPADAPKAKLEMPSVFDGVRTRVFLSELSLL